MRGSFLRGITERENLLSFDRPGSRHGRCHRSWAHEASTCWRGSARKCGSRSGSSGRCGTSSDRSAKEEILARYAAVYMNGQAWLREGGGILLRPAARDLYHRRRRQGRLARGHCQVASRLRAERQGRGPRPAPPKPDADVDAGEWVPIRRPAPSRACSTSWRTTSTSLAPAVVEHVLEELTVRHAGIAWKISCRDESRSTRQRTRACSDRQRRVGARPRPLRKRHPRARVDPGLGRGAAQPRWTDPRRGGRTTGLQRPLGLL